MMDRRLRWLPVLPLLWATTGCSLTPAFSLPEAPVPKQWPVVIAAEQSAPQPPPWRAFYDNPLLQKLVSTALESSRDLKAATARMERARALLGATHSSRWPTLQGEASQQSVRVPADLSASGQPAISQRADVGVRLPAFELDFWGRLRSMEEAARATYLASEESMLAVQVILISQVMETWLTWRGLSEQVVIAEAQWKAQQAIGALVAQREKAGIATAQGKWLAEIGVEGVRAELADLKRQAALSLNALQLLTGESLDPLQPWPALHDLVLAVKPPQSLPAQVLAARPDVRAAEHHLMAANANIGVARAAFWPRITLTSSVGSASQGLRGLFQPGSASWSFLPQLELPIFDFSRRQQEQAAVEAERAVLLAEYEKVLQQAFREVADGLTSHESWLERLQAMAASRTAQRARLALIRDRFQAGLDGRQAVLEAEQALHAIEQQIRVAQRYCLINQVALYKALGGGVH
ncbi:MAG: efflux transporter outer membrane subunit [Magnetococcales bacterium]|nr:efflux transporter outer membrane subunit [Magnetococcales bacterium]